jgi:hypothetical protein
MTKRPEAACYNPAALPMEEILEGNLSCFEVPDLLTFLNMGRRTSVLVLERPNQESKLFLREGSPVYATSTKDELRLGNMLVRLGKVTAQAMQRILDRQAGGSYRVGQLLVGERILTEEELASFLKVQVSEVIFDSFGWREGLFTVFDRVPPPATAVTLEMDLQNLIMEGVRRMDVRGRLKEVFRDLDQVAEATVNIDRVKSAITLTQDEWSVFFLVDGRRSLSEICRLAGNPDELATLETLHHLLQAKFIAVAPPRTAPAPSPAPAVADAGAEPEGTQRFVEGQPPAPPPADFSVEFNPPVARKLDDDTKEVVRPQAVPYLGSSNRLTVSRLVLLAGGRETSFPLTRDTYTLGRHRNNDIVVNDPKVSSFHARIDRGAEGFAVVDLKSRNGTFINGKRVATGVLKHGDEVRLGTARLLYKVDYQSA